jgi:hypothetical protein
MKKTTPAFKQAARKQDPSVFDYAREVEQVWRDFPETEKMYFLDICKRELVYPGESAKKKTMLQLLDNKKDLLSDMKQMDQVENSSCYVPCHKAMLLYTQQHKYPFLDRRASQAMETMFVFDHEMGHAVIPNAGYFDGKNKAECIADAYAVIRHLQRYGAGSAAIDMLVQQRAFQFIFRRGRASHLTSPVVEQILARRHEIAWDSLTPAETTKLAWRFAMEYAMHPTLLDVIDRDLRKFQGRIGDIQGGATASLQELAEKVLSTDVSAVFKYGAEALKLCFDRQMTGVILAGEYWDNVRQQLAEKQKTLDAQGKLLFGLGGKSWPPQVNSAEIVVDYTPLMNIDLPKLPPPKL